MKVFDLEDGPINQHHHDKVTYKTVSSQEDIMYGEEVINSSQTIEEVEEDGAVGKLKKMEMSN